MTARIGEFEIEPYTDHALPCPKCSGFGNIERYAQATAYHRGYRGELRDGTQFGGRAPVLPHLVIGCSTCGWEWLMHPKDARASGGVVSIDPPAPVAPDVVWLDVMTGTGFPKRRPWWRRKK